MPHLVGSFVGGGTAPTVSATATADTTVRAAFSEPMDPLGLNLLGNFTLAPDAFSISRSIIRVLPEAAAFPTFVDLFLDGEMTIGVANYSLTIPGTFKDRAGNQIAAPLAVNFDGRGTRPFIVLASAAEERSNKVRVHWSEAVGSSAEVTANYAITGPSIVSVLSVERLTSALIELTVSGQRVGSVYQLAPSQVKDLAGNENAL